jgi:hypothetical protein
LITKVNCPIFDWSVHWSDEVVGGVVGGVVTGGVVRVVAGGVGEPGWSVFDLQPLPRAITTARVIQSRTFLLPDGVGSD